MKVRWFNSRFTLWLIIALALIFYFARGLDWAEIKGSFQEMDLFLAVASIVPILATYLVRALRWRTLLAPIAKPTIRNLFAATVVGFSTILIFGRIGEITRPVMLSLRERIQPSATLATILIERLFDSTAVVLIFAVDMVFLERVLPQEEDVIIRTAGLTLLGILVLVIVGLSIFRRRAPSILKALERSPMRIPKRTRRILHNLLRHLAGGLYVFHDGKGLFVTVGYTALVWTLVVLSFWLLAKSFGAGLSILSILFVLGFALVGSLVPTPGGSAGAFHTTTMIGLIALGMEQNKAASLAIAMHIVAFGSALFFGVYFFIRDGLSFQALQEMAAQEMVSLHGASRSQGANPDATIIGAEL